MTVPRTLLLSTVVGLVGGTLGALLVLASAQTDDEASGKAGILADTEALDDRIAALEDENRLLRARLDTLADRPQGPLRLPADLPTREEFDALAAEVRAGSVSPDPAALAAVPPPALQSAVDQVLQQREEAARLERERLAREKLDQRIERQVERWTKELALTRYQEERMTELLTQRELDAAELKGAYNSGRMEAPTVKAEWEVREQGFREGLAGTLSPTQLQSYDRANAGAKDGG